MKYSEILINRNTGEVTITPQQDSTWIDQQFVTTRNAVPYTGTVCLSEDVEKRKVWLVEKIIKEARKEVSDAENKLNALTKLLKGK